MQTPGSSSRQPSLVRSSTSRTVTHTNKALVHKHAETHRRMINQFVMIKKVGKGQHGTVYLAQDLTANRRVAVKAVRKWDTKALSFKLGMEIRRFKKVWEKDPWSPIPAVVEEHLNRLRKEIAVMKKCDHPHLVKLYECIDDSTSAKLYLVMEYMGKGEVKWRTGEGRQPALKVRRVRQIIRDTISGLEYLHHQGIIHRDIKPGNLLVDEDDTVKIADFGASTFSYALRLKSAGPDVAEQELLDKLLIDEHDLAKFVGSPACLAPELCDLGGGTPVEATAERENGTSSAPVDYPYQSFAIPQPVEEDTSAGDTATVGSPDPDYRPPFVRGSSASSARTIQRQQVNPTSAIDVWALGITLYFLLFGSSPYGNYIEGAVRLMNLIPTWEFTYPSHMGADQIPTGGKEMDPEGEGEGWEVIDLFSRLLDKDPEKRMTLPEMRKHPWILRDLEGEELATWLLDLDARESVVISVQQEEADTAIGDKMRFKRLIRKGMSLLRMIKGKKEQEIGERYRRPSTSSVSTSGVASGVEDFASTSDRLGLSRRRRDKMPAISLDLGNLQSGSSTPNATTRSPSIARRLSGLAPSGLRSSHETPRSRSPAISRYPTDMPSGSESESYSYGLAPPSLGARGRRCSTNDQDSAFNSSPFLSASYPSTPFLGPGESTNGPAKPSWSRWLPFGKRGEKQPTASLVESYPADTVVDVGPSYNRPSSEHAGQDSEFDLTDSISGDQEEFEEETSDFFLDGDSADEDYGEPYVRSGYDSGEAGGSGRPPIPIDQMGLGAGLAYIIDASGWRATEQQRSSSDPEAEAPHNFSDVVSETSDPGGIDPEEDAPVLSRSDSFHPPMANPPPDVRLRPPIPLPARRASSPLARRPFSPERDRAHGQPREMRKGVNVGSVQRTSGSSPPRLRLVASGVSASEADETDAEGDDDDDDNGLDLESLRRRKTRGGSIRHGRSRTADPAAREQL